MATTSPSSFFDSQAFKDVVYGIGAGLRSFDPNNDFAGAGAAMMAAGERGRREEDDRKKMEMAFEQWKKQNEITFGQQAKLTAEERDFAESQRMAGQAFSSAEAEKQRDFARSQSESERKWREEQADADVQRAIDQLMKTFEARKSMRGEFTSAGDNMLQSIFGDGAVNFGASPKRYVGARAPSSTPTMAMNGTVS